MSPSISNQKVSKPKELGESTVKAEDTHEIECINLNDSCADSIGQEFDSQHIKFEMESNQD